jgi:hypothetical protein
MVKSFIIYKQAVAEQQLIITVSSLMSHLPSPAGRLLLALTASNKS